MIENLVQVKRSKRAKRVALRLDPVERVVNLVVPPRMSLKRAYLFAEQNKEWVEKTLGTLADPIPFEDGTRLPVFGDKMRLDINYDPSLKRTTIEQDGYVLRINTYMEDPTNRITAYLKNMARAGLADIATDKADMIRRKIASITVRDTKTRWGSCSQDRQISFSWRLMFAPYEAIDYVVAHEVAHLRYMDHSEKFWDLCADLSYDYEEGKEWMQKHGNELMRYGKQP